jgi:hypothetical protein
MANQEIENEMEQVSDEIGQVVETEQPEKKKIKLFSEYTPEERALMRQKAYETRKAKNFEHTERNKKKWLMRKELQKQLKKTLPQLTTSLIDSALSGNVRAYEIIRDTIGEKPIEEAEVEHKGLEVKIEFVKPESQ